MRIAQFQGISIESRAIKFLTRSRYSHSAWVFDEQTVKAIDLVESAGVLLNKLNWRTPGAVVEAWDTGVRNVASISEQHTPGTVVDIFDYSIPLTLTEEIELVKLLNGDIGDKYGFLNVIRFVTRRPGNLDKSWFCSELVFQRSLDIGRRMLNNTLAWEVPPGWIPRSTLLNPTFKRVMT